MTRQSYCVYNHSNECFLSLGVTLGDPLGSLKRIFGVGSRNADEGSWLVQKNRLQTFGFFNSPDVIYLDKKCRVVHTFEAASPFRLIPLRSDSASVLALPRNTIYSSQTQRGNQLVICAAEEMDFRLRNMPNLDYHDLGDRDLVTSLDDLPKSWLSQRSSDERRSSGRRRWPKLIAYKSSSGSLTVHGVKNLSAYGLYLVTDERWPRDSEVILTLQRTDGVDANRRNAVSVKLRVIRCGKDGVAMAFVPAGAN